MDITDALAGIGRGVIEARKRAGVHGVTAADGMEYCAKCGEPLLLSLKFTGYVAEKLGDTRYVPRNCQCMREMFEAEDRAIEKAKRVEAMERKRIESIPADKCRKNTFSADDGRDPKIRRMCEKYVGKWEDMIDGNFGLAFIGENEGGKTFWASCIANALIDAGASVLMTTIPQLISELSDNFGEDREYTLRRIKNVQFLILDDFGFERNSSFSLEKAFEIIDARYNAGKPLIITSNLSEDALKNPQDMSYSRIYSRVLEMCPALIKIEGKRRQELAAQKRKQLAEMLKGE